MLICTQRLINYTYEEYFCHSPLSQTQKKNKKKSASGSIPVKEVRRYSKCAGTQTYFDLSSEPRYES